MSKRAERSQDPAQNTAGEVDPLDDANTESPTTATEDNGEITVSLDPEPSPEETVATAAQEEIAALRDQMLRLAADFDNYRKRSIREQQETRDYGISQVLHDFLPVLDNLDRALSHCTDDSHPVIQGVKLVSKQFADAFARHGAQPVQAVGVPFDPERHEAVAQLPSAEHKPGTIIEEVQKGYTLNGRLLRAAKVVVAAPSADASSSTATE